MINNLPPKEVTGHQLLFALQRINSSIEELGREQAITAERLSHLESETQGLRKAWDTGLTLVRGVRLLAAFALALAALWALISGLFTFGGDG